MSRPSWERVDLGPFLSDAPATVLGSATSTLGDSTMTHSLDDIENAPATGGDQFRNADHEGDLIVLTVKDTGHETFDSGDSEFIVADITVVEVTRGNEGEPGDAYEDAWVFGKVIFGQLKRKVGRTFVGRIVKEQTPRKGKSPAWVLDPASPDEVERVREFMRSRLTPPPAPAAAPAGGPAPTELDDTPPWARK